MSASSRPRFSIVTWTSGLSHGRTSIGPSNVESVRSGFPLTVKCLSSRTTCLKSASTMTHPEATSVNASSAKALVERNMATSIRRLDGRGHGGVSRIHQLPGDIGLDDGEVRVENDKVGNRLFLEDAVSDQA